VQSGKEGVRARYAGAYVSENEVSERRRGGGGRERGRERERERASERVCERECGCEE
jgi:hypothetical protein